MDVAQRRNFFANAAAATRAVGENTGGGVRDDDDDESEDDLELDVGRTNASCGRSRRKNDEKRTRSTGGVVLT
jgi:hypothetical protein